MFHLYFVRHGQTEWNRSKRFQGQTNTSLNELGERQAKAVAGALREVSFDVMYSSDLDRAYQTAQYINEFHGLDILTDTQLRERSFGCFEGHTIEESAQKFPDIRQQYEADKLNFQIPGGESRKAFIQRVGVMIENLYQKHAGQTVAVVSHGGVMGAMVSHIISKKLRYESPQFIPLFTIQNCSISQLEVRGDQWLIHTLNEIHHLQGLIDKGRPVGDYA